MYCYIEFKLTYLENLIFSLKVKALFEAIVSLRIATGVCSFKRIFLRNRSLSNATWFCSGKCKIWKGKNQFGGNKICCAEVNHNYMSNMCEREFSDSNFKLRSYWQNIDFSKDSHIHKNCNFQVQLQFFRPTASIRINFMEVACKEYSFSIYQLWAVNTVTIFQFKEQFTLSYNLHWCVTKKKNSNSHRLHFFSFCITMRWPNSITFAIFSRWCGARSPIIA